MDFFKQRPILPGTGDDKESGFILKLFSVTSVVIFRNMNKGVRRLF